ncbi:pyridine nucleotide-disulfide oxidoreductase [Nocardioides seonyuensis]|uniref:ferredoxin--NADP(+) reductase n=1 Tax=Nocardioides seonyuensis TaxID=2518371 RepID=A0A4P7IL13_9ACTN|nr:FAD-dependent oxidoreductase [Nocardioides seonyuensis]QBX56721.1 pyridine nucleotide-disulfide oxidoreductase [Nocardioides seonyuensis]
MTSPDTVLRVAIVGAGPAGIYAADQLVKAARVEGGRPVSVDILERLPAPFGLVRYGVAPDHPRIKEIVKALQRVLSHDEVRLLGNVDLGTDLKLEELREFYDAVVVATGAMSDRSLGIPGEDLPGSFGAADFVSWYDAHPDVPRTWPLEAEHVAVLGVGNVALDVARVLAKTGEEMLSTDIPPHVHEALVAKRATDVHVFARRGPAYAKFSPLELRELTHSPHVDVIVHPEGFEVDEASMAHIAKNKQAKMVLDTLANWVGREPEGKAHRIHLHFLEQPVEILGDDAPSGRRVTGLRTERTRLVGDGSVEGTGQTTDWDVQAVYRAVGYRSTAIADLPFDDRAAVVPNDGGRVLDLDGRPLPGTYVTGWIKRGPVGLIGHTKSDAAETVAHLLAETTPTATARTTGEVDAFLVERGVDVADLDHWLRLDQHEIALGEAQGRLRVKVPGREEMLTAGRD